MIIHSVMRSYTPTEQPVKPPAKQKAILDAALKLFAERTYDGTAMPLVAERAGVGAGTIYRYFENKEALVNALYRRCQESLARRLVDSAPVGVCAREEFRHWWRGLCWFAREEPEASAFLETQSHAFYLEPQSFVVRDRIRDAAGEFIQRAQAAGEIRLAPPFLLGVLVVGAYVGLLKSARDSGHPLSDETIDLAEDCVWKMLRA
jgi:AcrR family transcriptional regulator